jgi:hypothetical protein
LPYQGHRLLWTTPPRQPHDEPPTIARLAIDQSEPHAMTTFELVFALLLAYLPMLSGYIMSTGFAD